MARKQVSARIEKSLNSATGNTTRRRALRNGLLVMTAGVGATGTVAARNHGQGRGPPTSDERNGGRGPPGRGDEEEEEDGEDPEDDLEDDDSVDDDDEEDQEDQDTNGLEPIGDTFGYYFPAGVSPMDVAVEPLTDVGFHALGIDNRGHPVVNHDREMAALAEHAHDVGTTPHLQIGGWGVDFSPAVDNAEAFATEAVDIMIEYGYQGIDIDWEYPDDGAEFADLMLTIREELDNRGEYHLGAAVSVVPSIADGVYGVDTIAPIVDYLFLMCYDFAGPWSSRTGHNSALHSTDTEWLSVARGIDYWQDTSIDDDKLIAGIPFYGRSFTGVADENDGYDQPFDDGGSHTYPEVRAMVDDPAFSEFWDDEAEVPFAYSADDGIFLSHESPRSIKLKAEYIRDSVGGVGIWAINQDYRDELMSAMQ